MSDQDPPKWAERFFHWMCARIHLEGLEGDLFELYERRVSQKGSFIANIYYLIDIVSLMRSSVIEMKVINSKSNTMGMLSNYLKVAYRNSKRNKMFSSINLFGLTLGITAVLFISVYLWNETSYDRFFSNADNKYRVFDQIERDNGEVSLLPIVPPTISGTLQDNFSQVKKAGRMYYDYGGTVFRIGEKVFSETNGYYTELPTLEILDVELIAGSKEGLKEPYSFLLSESTFEKFFGEVGYDNQTVQLGSTSFTVAGIYKDFSKRSHIRPDYLISFELLASQTPEGRMKSWVWHQFYTYVELNDNADVQDFTEQVQSFIQDKTAEELASYGMSYTTHFQPLEDIHLHSSDFNYDLADRNSYQNIFFLFIASIVILLIAAMNFINLTSAQLMKRAKEVGVRKFVGAGKGQVFLQHCIESLFFVGIAGMISVGLFILLLPAFNQFTDKTFILVEIASVAHISYYLTFLILLGLIAGAYPATLFNRVRAIQIVRGLKVHRVNIGKRMTTFDPRHIMVGIQYVLCIGLIIISLVVHKQYQFMRNADLGFNKENLILIPTVGPMRRDMEGTRNVFTEYSNVEKATFSYSVPGGIVAGDGVILPRMGEKEQSASLFVADHGFVETLELEIVAGRNFEIDRGLDHAQAFIINEEAVRAFGLGSPEDALGEVIHWKHWSYPDSIKKGKVIGVIGDFNTKSMHQNVSPSVIHLLDSYMPNLIVRIGNGDLAKTVEHLEQAYKSYAPQRPFEFTFLDETFDEFYQKEQKMAQIFSLFTWLSIITALIGLLGLVNFNISNRGKELSIRKVLGAGGGSIYQLLVKKYLWLAGISFIITVPIAYYLVQEWLENFAYRISLDAWIFLKVGVLILFLTITIVSWYTIKGIRTNPADRLRTD